jgi:arabinofuranosyltransferase
MQYARNIATGHGFSFNADEPSYGVTGPLWVFFMTIPYFAGIDGFLFSKLLDLLFFILSVLIFYRLAVIYFGELIHIALLALSVFMINAWFIRWSFTGMETSFAVFMVLLSFYLYFTYKYKLLFFVLGAFQLVRPESFVLSAIFFVYLLVKSIKSNSFSIKDILLFIICYLTLLIPFFVYAYINFGTILPNTALGKSTLTFSLTTIINQVRDIFKTLSGANIIEMILTAVFLVFYFLKELNEKYILPLVWIAGLIVLYTITDADIISRYLLIISPFFILIGFTVFSRIKKMNTVLFILIYLLFASFSEFIFYNYVKPHTDNFTKGVNEGFIPVGKWLNDNTPPGSKILVNDVGAIGYYSGRYIIDAAALVNNDLDLNKKIMNSPLEKRMHTHMLLDVVKADYVIERDTSSSNDLHSFNNLKFELVYMKEFPGLGIKDDTPKFYKVYKVSKLEIR